jgi:ABC-type glycerol-3-phosphate transport system substrate-binding protein
MARLVKGSMSRRQFHAAVLGGTAALSGWGGTRAASAATALTSVAAMVAEGEVAWEKEMAGKWNQAHPEAPWTPEDVGWEAISPKVLAYEKAGSPPNLGYGWTGFTTDWHRMGIIDAPEDYLGKSWKDRFAAHITRPGGDVINGKLWAVPIQDAYEALVCRRDWLREVGVDPYSILTWDHLVDAAAQVARAKSNKPYSSPMGLARPASDRTEWIFLSNGLNHQADFDPAKREAYIQALEMILRLRPYIPDDAFVQDYTGHRQAFATGVAGFIPIGDYYYGEVYPIAKSLMTKDHVVIIPYPGGPKGRPVTFFALNSYYMMAHAKDKEKTAQLVEFLTRRENLLRWSLGHPPLKQWTVDEAVKQRLYGETERWWLDDVLALGNKARVVPTSPMLAKDEVQQVFYEHLLKVLDKKMTPAEAYDAMRPQITALTKAAGG